MILKGDFMNTYKQLYAFLVGNQSDALDLLTEGRVIEAIMLLQKGLLAAEGKANVRFANNEQYEWIHSYVDEVAKKTHVEGCTCTVDHPKGRPAMEYCERNIELLGKINAALEKCSLETLEVSKSLGGSDAADVTVFGIPCVDSLGVRGGKIHTPAEFAYIDSLAESAKRLAAIICYL